MQRDSNEGPNPSGLCMCGCGEKTRIAPNTRSNREWIKGQPMRYISGHGRRGSTISEAGKQRVSEFHKGRPHPKGKDSHGWKGGGTSLKGRTLTYVGKGHPMAPDQVYVMEHRLVAADALGRPLQSEEHVHHIDLNPRNNEAANLSILTRGQHKKLHCLVDKGADPRDALRQVRGFPVTQTPTERESVGSENAP